MSRVPLIVGVPLAALAASGCLHATTLMRVKPDGSGTLEQTILVSTAAFAQMGSLIGGLGGQAGRGANAPPSTPADLLSEAQAKEMAAKMGAGVRFVSRTPQAEGDMQGVRALFAFDDVNTVGLQQTPSPGGLRAGGRGEDPVHFTLTKTPSGSALLTASFPDRRSSRQGTADETPSSPRPKPDPQQLAMFQQMLKGMKVAIDVEVVGRLITSSSPYVTGNRVSLLEIDFDQLLASPDALERLGDRLGPGSSISEARAMLKDVKGLKINEPTVTIEFK